MDLKLLHEEGYMLAATVGNVDETAKKPFRESLYPLVGQSGTKVVLDLSQFDFSNSSGIAQLISLVNRATACGSRVISAACSPFILDVLVAAHSTRSSRWTTACRMPFIGCWVDIGCLSTCKGVNWNTTCT